MNRKLLCGFVTLMALGLAVGTAGAAEVSIGVCQPETDASAQGWDQTPALGNWGGKDESEFAVVWESDAPDKPGLFGREALCTIPGLHGVRVQRIKLNYLEGLANDDYCVFVRIWNLDVRIGCFDEESATEEWHTREFMIPPVVSPLGMDVTVRIVATGNSWSGFNTFGQMAVDWIEAIGVTDP